MMKEFLSKNEIYFKTVTGLALSAMALIVSFASVYISYRQYAINAANNIPVFKMEVTDANKKETVFKVINIGRKVRELTARPCLLIGVSVYRDGMEKLEINQLVKVDYDFKMKNEGDMGILRVPYIVDYINKFYNDTNEMYNLNKETEGAKPFFNMTYAVIVSGKLFSGDEMSAVFEYGYDGVRELASADSERLINIENEMGRINGILELHKVDATWLLLKIAEIDTRYIPHNVR